MNVRNGWGRPQGKRARALAIVAIAIGAAGSAACAGNAGGTEEGRTSSEALRHRGGGTPDAGGGAPSATCTHLATPPASCADWKFLNGFTDDGCYGIDTDGAGPRAAFDVHCTGMASYAPREYVELDATSSPDAPGANASVFSGGGACPCGDYAVAFDEVRLDTRTMTIVLGDRTFASASDASCIAAAGAACAGATTLGYGVAASCAGAADASGVATIDLTGTPLHIADGALFAGAGAGPGGDVTISADRKVATVRGGGACGSFGATSLAVEPDVTP